MCVGVFVLKISGEGSISGRNPRSSSCQMNRNFGSKIAYPPGQKQSDPMLGIAVYENPRDEA